MGTSPPPAPAIKPTFDKHLDAIKWVIGLPVAVLFGTTQFVEKIDFAKHPSAHSLFLAIICVNAATVVASVWYYFRAIKRADDKFESKPSPWTSVDSFCYYGGLLMFAVGFGLAVVGLINYPGVQFERTPPSPPLPSSYAISVSGPVRDGMGTHVHTLMVNQITGEVWQMECKAPAGVQFLRVPVQDLPPPSKPKNPAK
jgi:hypothetical protein